ncbi:MAG: DUF2853 family protein [Hyphomicrobiaceae bacterium]|nr:DUF2853 family protein [Hyphomicrobiaceae bacterium]
MPDITFPDEEEASGAEPVPGAAESFGLGAYVENIDEAAVAAIVRHLGIALRSADASLVSCSDLTEIERVRESWLKKKLALTDDDATLDAAIAEVCVKMRDERRKHRVPFYYLLAAHFGKLGELAG